MVTLQEYKNSVDEATWASSMVFAASLKRRGTKIAFFNSTPQGGGVALMRHALIRFFGTMDIDCRWWVFPNILQPKMLIHTLGTFPSQSPKFSG